MTAEADRTKAGSSDSRTGPPNSVADEAGPGEAVVEPPVQPDPVFHDRTIPAPAVGAGIGFRTRLTFA
ncbi:MAG TPA: hypothetical protein VIB99_02710, partial [Candidatus Limnocylindrales bacterium]